MVLSPVSVGELIDKLSILHVKQRKIINEEKLNYINKEFEILYNLSSEYLNNSEIENTYHDLVKTNSLLWDVEDKLRILEKEQKFDKEFIELSRKVYITNDERFRLKDKINQLTSSDIREMKEYVKYQ
jgi:hypothetical protein